MNEPIQVITTTSAKEDAARIARELVDRKLAGCVQVIGPITSTYCWKGNVEIAEEWLCLMKSRRQLFDAIERAIKAVHPYETPEIIAVPIVAGSKDYLAWLDEVLEPPASSRS